ncbi:MAG: Lrp/AsnC family transcriptional regulator [Acidobacteria bacterium]|nr:Lrp/AsnC family transcriptional regulator [Acidobacteriota bacterium]
MDEMDLKLLKLVQTNGKLSYAELGEGVGLSISAVNERLKKLQTQGLIRDYVARLNPAGLGLDLLAFIAVVLAEPMHEPGFLDRMAAVPEILECHHVTGDFSYLLKVRVKNTSALEKLLKEQLKTIPGLVRTYTTIVLSTAKETTALPIE